MHKLTRHEDNPIVLPSIHNSWESAGAFNGCVTKRDHDFVMVYRAMTHRKFYLDANLEVSSIGQAISSDGVTFSKHKQLIAPEASWEQYGCEDPRITKIDNQYYIFYTALSGFPFSAANIKVAVALSPDGETISEKHLVTPFNAKAMSLFPEKVQGKYVAILSANTDMPPAKIGLAFFDSPEEFWSESYWNSWYLEVDSHMLPLLRSEADQVEVGAPPLLTEKGWLLIFSYIRNYYSDNKVFGIEAVLLDKDNPHVILARTLEPLLVPEKTYELYGNIPNVVFPSGALIKDEDLFVYYGAADTSVGVAIGNLNQILDEMVYEKPVKKTPLPLSVTRFEENPILLPLEEHAWENKAVFNPTAIYLDNTVHLLYRAMGTDNISVMGYATSTDGLHISERLPFPVYTPREPFEISETGGNSGCEDARITQFGERLYICYTAFDGGAHPPRVALSSIAVTDFLQKEWKWETPHLISPPDLDDKDACLFPSKIKGKYAFLHRLNNTIWIDYVDSLEFPEGKYLDGEIIMEPRSELWDSSKIGVAGPPLATEKGWVLLYHGIDAQGFYKLGAALLEKDDPSKILVRLDHPILEPIWKSEREGQIPNVVFPCGQVVIDDTLYIYYGGADSVVSVATVPMKELLSYLLHHAS